MAPRLQLQTTLSDLEGVKKAYFQPGQNITLEYPCIVYSRYDSFLARADNIAYWLKKRYTVTVLDRNPDSLIPDQVEALPYSRFDRFYVADGINHTVFQVFF